MSKFAIFITAVAVAILANMSYATPAGAGFVGNFSMDPARGIGPQPNGYIWLKECQAAGRCPED